MSPEPPSESPIVEQPWRPSHNPWVIAVVVSTAAFMEILDTSIANVSLPYIAGNLGVSTDEGTWVLTSYLVSNAVVLPLSGWLAGRFGRKRFFMMCLSFFTLSSLFCGISANLPMLLLFRIFQGTGGGGLQPMAQAILADSFPPEQRGLAFALYGITAIMAPTIGPTLGGWITFNFSWRWIFLINLPVGIAALLFVFRLVEDPPYLSKLKGAGIRIDYVGIALLVLGVGALQVMLDRGQQDDWFGSRFILLLAVISTICLLSLAIWEWFQKEPIIDVRLFKNLNYAGANLMMFTTGIILFSSVVMMPLFLQTLLGYTAQVAGLVLSGGALVLLLEMPLIGQLTTKIQTRYLIAFGWLCLAAAMYYSTKRIDLLISFRSAMGLRVVQVVGLGFLFVPISLAAYAGIPAEKSNAVAGMINFMRNIGSSIGTSAVTTMLAQRSQLHQSVLASHLTASSAPFQNALNGLTRHLTTLSGDIHKAQMQALARIYRAMQAQAMTLAYIDIYRALGVAAACMFFLSFLLRKTLPGAREHVPVE